MLHTLLFIIKLDTDVFTLVIVYRPVGAGGAGGAIAIPDFVRSLNPGGQIRPTTLLLAPQIFSPSYGPALLMWIDLHFQAKKYYI